MATSVADDDSPASAFLQSIRRDLNCLCDSDRSVRCRALGRLQKSLSDPPTSVLQEVWDHTVLHEIVKTLLDDTEKCRELSISVLNTATKKLDEMDKTTSIVIPLIFKRIGIIPILENSEEIRLSLINLLRVSIISRCSLESLDINIEPISKLLSIALADPFHEIKKAACETVSLFVKRYESIPEHISLNLVKSLLSQLNHSHSKVRIAVLQGMNAIMLEDFPDDVISELVVPSIRHLAFDHIEQVRHLFFKSVALWMGCEDGSSFKRGNTSNFQHRVRHFLPLLLLGVSDESGILGSESLALVEAVGKVYDEKCRKIFDCCNLDTIVHPESPSKPSGNDTERLYLALLPAPFNARPGQRCQKLIQVFLEDILIPLKKSIQDWTSKTRFGAARILQTVLVMVEDQSGRYLELIMPIIYSAVKDDDVVIARLIIKSSHVLGWHVSPCQWLPWIIQDMSNSGSSLHQVANSLVILSGLLYGTRKETFYKKAVIETVNHLFQINVTFGHFIGIQRQVLSVVRNLLHAGHAFCTFCSVDILMILLQVQSFECDQQLRHKAINLEDTLAQAIGLNTGKELYEKHVPDLIDAISQGHESWSADSSGYLLFQRFMQKCGCLVSEHILSLLPVFKDCISLNRDPALRIKILQLLDDLFEIPELERSWCSIASIMINDIIAPCSVWHVGKVGAAIRHAAMVAFGTLLRQNLCNQITLENILSSAEALSVTLSCLDEEHYVDLRLIACHVLESILRIVGNVINDSQRALVKKALQNRLDDNNDNVRFAALLAIAAFFQTLPLDSDTNVKSFLRTIVLHMDDRNEHVRDAVYRTLQVCTMQRPTIVKEVLEEDFDKNDIADYCDMLLAKAAYQLDMQKV